MIDPDAYRPLGVFDSGVGGLSVLRAIHQELPQENVIYLADQAHVPYGPRPMQEVREFAESISRYLIRQGVKLVVVACNAASAAALKDLRQAFPHTPFVGMEPAVKPAAETTRSGVVGVLATPATFQGALYASVVERFAQDVELLQDPCQGLVAQIEAGNLNGEETRAILERALRPMLGRGIDTIVMGCTHYPFVIPLIQEIAGPQVRVIDPAPAVARQVRRVLEKQSWLNPGPASLAERRTARFLTSGDPARLRSLLPLLLPLNKGEAGQVERLDWLGSGQIS